MAALTDDLEQRIVTSVSRGVSLNRAALAAGLTAETISEWRRLASGATVWSNGITPVNPDYRQRILNFLTRVARAESECYERMVHQLEQNAVTLDPKNGRGDTLAIDRLLSKAGQYRREWHEYREVNVQQHTTITHEHQLAAAASLDELEGWSQAIDALPSPSSTDP